MSWFKQIVIDMHNKCTCTYNNMITFDDSTKQRLCWFCSVCYCFDVCGVGGGVAVVQHTGKCIRRFAGIYAYCRYFIDRMW